VQQWGDTNATLLRAAIAALGHEDQEILTAALPVLDRLVAAIHEQSELPAQS
jgi:cytolysin (calcineurin-like family phosphatase)